MSTSKIADQSLPPPVAASLEALGRNIRIARKRRRMGEQDLATLAHTSRATIRRLESGAPGVGLGILASVLWVLQLHDDLGRLAAPDTDVHGLFMEQGHLPRRIRTPASRVAGVTGTAGQGRPDGPDGPDGPSGLAGEAGKAAPQGRAGEDKYDF